MNKRDFSFKHSLTTLSVCSLLAFSATHALAQTGDAPVWRTDLTGGETTTYALSDLAPGMAANPSSSQDRTIPDTLISQSNPMKWSWAAN